MLDKDLFDSRLNKQWTKILSWIMIKKHIKLMHSQYLGQNVIHIFYLSKALNWLVELSTLIFNDCETCYYFNFIWENTDLDSIRNVSSALVSVPIRLPRHKNLLTMPYAGEMHPLQRIKVVACFVSDDHSRMMAFQSWMQKSYRLYEMK